MVMLTAYTKSEGVNDFKMRKKLIAKILVLCMMLSMMAVPAHAMEQLPEGEEFNSIEKLFDSKGNAFLSEFASEYVILNDVEFTKGDYFIDMSGVDLRGSVRVSSGKLEIVDTADPDVENAKGKMDLEVTLAGGSFAYDINTSCYVIKGSAFQVKAAYGYKLNEWTEDNDGNAVITVSRTSSGSSTGGSTGGGAPATTPTTQTSSTVTATAGGKVDASALKTAMDKTDTNTVTVKLAEGEIALPDAVVAELLKVVGSDVTFELKTSSTNSALNDAQKNSVDGLAVGMVVSIKLISKGSEIKDFGGKITVSFPYTAPKGQSAEKTVVYFSDEKGTLTAMETSYADNKLTFTTTHNSEYVAIYEPFSDARTTDWFAKYVQYVFDKGYMNGMGDDKFQPNTNLSRAMMVTTLYRIKGASGGNPAVFSDVAEGKWFTEAINWAAAAKIASGMGDGTFAPDADMTREQMAQFLYNYAKANGADVTATGDLSQFADASAVSAWAQDAMKWAVGAGLINGMDGKLNPQGTATRAQVATVLTRFAQA